MKASDASLLMTIFCLSSGKHKKQFTLEGKKKKKNQPGGMCLNIVNLVFDFHRVIPHIYSTRAHQEKTAFSVTCKLFSWSQRCSYYVRKLNVILSCKCTRKREVPNVYCRMTSLSFFDCKKVCTGGERYHELHLNWSSASLHLGR